MILFFALLKCKCPGTTLKSFYRNYDKLEHDCYSWKDLKSASLLKCTGAYGHH